MKVCFYLVLWLCSLYPLPSHSSLSALAVAAEALNSKKLEVFVIQYLFVG